MSFIYRNQNNIEIDLTKDNIKIKSIDGISSLDNEINSQSSLNQQGETYSSSRVTSRDINIVLRIKSNLKEYSVIKRSLMKLFNPSLEGKLILKSPNGNKEIVTRVRISPDFKNTPYSSVHEVEINLIALDPYWKDMNETTTEIAIWKGNFGFPLFIPIDEGIIIGYREPSLIVNTNNLGDIKTGMKIEFKALDTVVNPKLVNIDTQDFIKINKILEAGEIITVYTDFSNKKVFSNKNGVIENAFAYWDLYSTFLQLEVGDNLFRYDADDGLDSLEVTIYHTSRYIGV